METKKYPQSVRAARFGARSVNFKEETYMNEFSGRKRRPEDPSGALFQIIGINFFFF